LYQILREGSLWQREDQVRVSLRSVQGCGSNGQKNSAMSFAGICTLSEYFPSSWRCSRCPLFIRTQCSFREETIKNCSVVWRCSSDVLHRSCPVWRRWSCTCRPRSASTSPERAAVERCATAGRWRRARAASRRSPLQNRGRCALVRRPSRATRRKSRWCRRRAGAERSTVTYGMTAGCRYHCPRLVTSRAGARLHTATLNAYTFITISIIYLYSANKVAMYINKQINKQKKYRQKRNNNVQ